MTLSFSIEERVIASDQPSLLIAEIAQAHDGSLALAHSYIDAVSRTGADAIKFQTHIAEAESTHEEPFRVHTAHARKESRFEYWKRTSFNEREWAELATHARDSGLLFLSSPFSLEAAQLLDSLGVPAWKLPSGELHSDEMISFLLGTQKPILASTGMSTWPEIDQLVNQFQSSNATFVLLQASSQYPVPLAQVGLNVLEEMRARYGCLVGLSDHSGSIWPSIAAVAKGASVIEVHVTFDRRIDLPDTTSSLTLDELKELAAARTALHELRIPIEKSSLTKEVSHTKRVLSKSIALKEPLRGGTILSREMLTMKKPGTGLQLAEMTLLVGRRLAHDVSSTRLLTWDDIDD